MLVSKGERGSSLLVCALIEKLVLERMQCVSMEKLALAQGIIEDDRRQS